MNINNLWSGYDSNSKKQNTRCLAVNTILEGKYLVGPVLGQGGFGITYVGYDLNMEAKTAIKEYFPVELVSRDTTTMHGDRVLSLSGEKSVTYKAGLKKYVAEAQNVSQFSEIPGVVSVKDFFYANETAYIVMEYIDGISLKDYLKDKGGSLSEEETLKIMKPILEALVQVHKSGIIHRDISPDNIMLTFEGSGHGKIKSVKLIDFGAARMTAKNDQKSLTIILKHGYAPEEQYRTHGEQGPWTDVYALCAVFYRMLTGETPVPAMDRMFQDELKTFDKFNTKVSSNTAAAILKGLAVKKDNRIQNVQELIGALYEGAKIKGAGKSTKKHADKKPIAIAACAAVVALVGASVLGSGILPGKNGVTASNQGEVGTIVGEQANVVSNLKAEDVVKTSDKNRSTEVGNVSFESRENLGPQIVWPRAETMIAGGFNHVVALGNDGTVKAAGENLRGQCEVTDWDNIAAVYASDYASVGLKTDGTVVTCGRIMGSGGTEDNLGSWNNIIDMAVCSSHVLGLTADGYVVSAGDGDNGCCDTGDWENIVDIWCEEGISFGVDQDGKLWTAGTMPHQEDVYEKIKTWTNIVDVDFWGGSGEYTICGIKADGTAVCEGEQAENQAKDLAEWTNVVSIEVGDGFIAGLKEDGTLLDARNTQNDEIENWTDVSALASTQYEVIDLKKDGTFIMTEPVVTGNSSLDEILAMDDIREAVWSDACLYTLNEAGNINLVGYVEYWRTEGQEEGTWSNIDSISACSEGIIAKTIDKKVKLYQPVKGTYTFDYDESLGLSKEEQQNQAKDQVSKTPHLWLEWTNVEAVARSTNHVVALLENGEVKTAGKPGLQTKDGVDHKTGFMKNGSSDTFDWKNIQQVAALNTLTVGLKENGTIVAAGESDVNWEEFVNVESIWSNGKNALWAISAYRKPIHILGSTDYGQGNTATWENLIQISPGSQHIAGLKADGTVVAVGSNFCGQCDVEEWTDIVSVAAGPTSTTGITSDGRILMAGTLPKDVWAATDWEPIDMTKIQND